MQFSNQTLWIISITVLVICLLLALIMYIQTDEIYIAILIAPPIIHWILRQKQKGK